MVICAFYCKVITSFVAGVLQNTIFRTVLFCSLAVLDLRVGHTMDVLSPFISVLQYRYVVIIIMEEEE